MKERAEARPDPLYCMDSWRSYHVSSMVTPTHAHALPLLFVHSESTPGAAPMK